MHLLSTAQGMHTTLIMSLLVLDALIPNEVHRAQLVKGYAGSYRKYSRRFRRSHDHKADED